MICESCHCLYHKSKILKNNNLKYLCNYRFCKHFIQNWISFLYYIFCIFIYLLVFILGFCQHWLRIKWANIWYMCHLCSLQYLRMYHIHNYSPSSSNLNPSSFSTQHSRKPFPIKCHLTSGYSCFANLTYPC